MKNRTQPMPAPVDGATPPPATLVVGSLKFTQLAAHRTRDAACKFTSSAKGKAPSLRFNAAMCVEHPALLGTDRVALFLADKPSVALAVCPDPAGVRLFKSKGDVKVGSVALAPLAKLYRRIRYRVEAVESPRRGWLLHPLESERHE
jgi:hypothetical protein